MQKLESFDRCRYTGRSRILDRYRTGPGRAGRLPLPVPSLGHTVTIFEATDRAGGLVHTYHDSTDPSKYIGELGAMRFPLDAHPYLESLI